MPTQADQHSPPLAGFFVKDEHMKRNIVFDAEAQTEVHATALENHPDFQVLRRLPSPGYANIWPEDQTAIRLAIVDTETTGLNAAKDVMIEIGATIVELNQDGLPAIIHPTKSWLNDPGFPLSSQIASLTGLTDQVLSGQSFDTDAINDTLHYADLIVAHNAAFDRNFMIRTFPLAAERQWACSCRDIGWRAEGYDGHALGHLLTQAGRFSDAHRAAADSWSLTWLLLQLASDGRTFAAHLVDDARKPLFRVYAAYAPFSIKDDLKAAGYRWDPGKHFWYRDRQALDVDLELEWLDALNPNIRPFSLQLDPLLRHAGM
jgi:DNA polymerase-3 subunit epsilon